jgi:surface polysaccharide O-acyltransferase-like enzyme
MSKASSEPGIDAFRFFNMFAVVFAHAWWFMGPIERDDPRYLLLMMAQCSVPTFFITSGYFLRWQEGGRFAVPRWCLTKLLPVFLFWVVVYAFLGTLVGLGSFPSMVLSTATGAQFPHLWFLPALGFAVSMTALALRTIGLRRTWILSVALAAVGLFNGTYQMFLGLEANPLRVCVLTAPLLVLIGIYFRNSNPPRWPLVFGLAVIATYCLQVWDDELVTHAPGYVVGKRVAVTLATIPYAVSVFLLARSLRPTRALEWLAARKQHLLLIYCVHPLILTLIGLVWQQRGFDTFVAVTIVTYALSALIAASLGLGRRRVRKHAVRKIAIGQSATMSQV